MEVFCSTCGAARSEEVANTAPRPPCPGCGGIGLKLQLEIASEVDVASSLSVALDTLPARDWKRRWEVLQGEMERLRGPQAGALSGDAIHGAQQGLQSFFIQAYHLKDALKADTASHGVSGSDIEKAITASPDLALLADLANLDKHFSLDRPPRSGEVPRVLSARGVQAGSGEGGWRLELLISHGTGSLDGLEVAEAAMRAWKRQLERWNLL